MAIGLWLLATSHKLILTLVKVAKSQEPKAKVNDEVNTRFND